MNAPTIDNQIRSEAEERVIAYLQPIWDALTADEQRKVACSSTFATIVSRLNAAEQHNLAHKRFKAKQLSTKP